MSNPRPQKVAVVDEVRSRMQRADAVIVTEYRGLKVKDLATLRRSLAPLGAEYKIYKNTLARLATAGQGPGFAELLDGPTALAFVQGDAAAVTKTLRDFARANPLLVIKGGALGKSVLGPEATVALADLPSTRCAAGPFGRWLGCTPAEPRRPVGRPAAQLRLRAVGFGGPAPGQPRGLSRGHVAQGPSP